MRARHIIAAIAATASMFISQSAFAAKLVALSIGVQSYTNLNPLKAPINDATRVAETLSKFGYEVQLVKDPNRAQLTTAIDNFIAAAQGADAAIVYYSGHGFMMNGESYITATDANVNQVNLTVRDEFAVDGIVERLNKAKVGFKFVIVDACRSNPFQNAPGSVRFSNAGRAEQWELGDNTLVSFGSAAGQNTQDWGAEIGSLYTAALLQVLEGGDKIEVRDLTQKTRQIVLNTIAKFNKKAQNPWEGSSMLQPAYFERTAGGKVTVVDPSVRFDTARDNGHLSPISPWQVPSFQPQTPRDPMADMRRQLFGR